MAVVVVSRSSGHTTTCKARLASLTQKHVIKLHGFCDGDRNKIYAGAADPANPGSRENWSEPWSAAGEFPHFPSDGPGQHRQELNATP